MKTISRIVVAMLACVAGCSDAGEVEAVEECVDGSAAAQDAEAACADKDGVCD